MDRARHAEDVLGELDKAGNRRGDAGEDDARAEFLQDVVLDELHAQDLERLVETGVHDGPNSLEADRAVAQAEVRR